MIRKSSTFSTVEVDKVRAERTEGRMLLRRWLKHHPDSPLAKQTEAWLTKNNALEDILR